jgi:hypothetical protein
VKKFLVLIALESLVLPEVPRYAFSQENICRNYFLNCIEIVGNMA